VTLVAYVIALVAMWVLAWGSLSVANVLGGLAVAGFLLWVAPDKWMTGERLRLRPVAIARLTLFALAEVVKSNVVLVRAILARGTKVHTGVMAVPLPECSDALLTVISNVLALTPGTTPLHLTRYPTVLYVHVLDMRDVESTRRDVQRLADLAYAAFGPRPEAPPVREDTT
jgi:multicomponent Na+:H+ antiporter subunit E